MIKCYLSHSSKEKNSYASIVARKLGKQIAIYDEYTFEEGMRPLDEILRGLDATQLFVVFLSDNSLQSEWVKREVIEAEKRLSSGALKQIYPLIIDPKITYKDPRIPEWMREEYNLKLVSQPIVAARRIKQKLREISWQFHPKLQQRKKIFVGRNAQIRALEERIDDFDLPIPSCIIASGMKQIGRRTFLKHALLKANVFSDSYRPPVMNLSRHESLEDFLLKLNDLGISVRQDLTGLLTKTVDEKIDSAVAIIREIEMARELLFILDDGCIVNYKRDIDHWFRAIVQKLIPSENTIFAIASSYRLIRRNVGDEPEIFVIDLPELSVTERKGLFKRYSEFEGLSFKSEDFTFFCNLLYGYPEQTLFAVDLIKDTGVLGAKKESYQIQEYNSEKASITLQKYSDNEDILEFIYLLSEFEIISLEFLYDIVDERKYGPVVEDLMARAVIDYIGVEGEFIRLNDAVRDYVRRNRFGIPDRFKVKLAKHLQAFVQSEDKFDRDVSDYIYSVKRLLMDGKEIPEKFLIPSHFLSTMRDLYQMRRHYERVVELADVILQKEAALEPTIRNDIQYYLCLALARRKDTRFLKEVQKVHGTEHNFLLGFYYRLLRRDMDALRELQKALESPDTAVRAKRELVQVYLYTEEYDLALSLARANYEGNRTNPYYIQAYFNCLININPEQNREGLLPLIKELYSVGSEPALEMGKVAEALLSAKCDNDKTKALNLIGDTIASYPDSPYPIISKFDICLRFKDTDLMRDTIESMENLWKRKRIYKESISRAKCLYYACLGEREEAIKKINDELRNLPKRAKDRLIERVVTLCGVDDID